MGADLTTDLKILQENLQSKFGGNALFSPTAATQDSSAQNLNKDSVEVGNILRRKISVGYQEERFASGYIHFVKNILNLGCFSSGSPTCT